jgi:hypothetical protein
LPGGDDVSTPAIVLIHFFVRNNMLPTHNTSAIHSRGARTPRAPATASMNPVISIPATDEYPFGTFPPYFVTNPVSIPPTASETTGSGVNHVQPANCGIGDCMAMSLDAVNAQSE